MEEHLLLILDYITPNKYPKNEPKRSFTHKIIHIQPLFFLYDILKISLLQ